MKNIFPSDMHLAGNEFLDSQRTVILSCMANVSDYLSAEIKGRDLFELVDRLDAYCKLHFLEEEKVMGEMQFVGIENHKAQHALFVRHLENFMGRNEELNRTKNIDALNSLKGWFLDHIVAFDKKYSERLPHGCS